MPSDKPLINFVVDSELLERIDEFRFSNRFSSRAAAIKHLISSGLECGKNVSAKKEM